MHNTDLVRRIQTGHGLLLDGSDPAFTFMDVAKLVDTVALGTTVNAEVLHDDLNQLAGRVATASDEGNRPDATEASQALMRVETAADGLLESLGGAEPDPVLARIFDRDSIQAILRIRFAARRAQSGAAHAGPDSQRQMISMAGLPAQGHLPQPLPPGPRGGGFCRRQEGVQAFCALCALRPRAAGDRSGREEHRQLTGHTDSKGVRSMLSVFWPSMRMSFVGASR